MRARDMRARARLLAACAVAITATGCLQTIAVDPDKLGRLAATTQVLAADGSFIATLEAEEDRRPLRLDEIPQVLIDAVLAIEDRRFYSHDGVDARGIARAAVRDVREGNIDEGGSTITQQLVKNTLVTPEKTLNRKVREAALALGLERSLTKDQILERYLNTVYFGQGSYGVGAAVRTYFGHAPDEVSLAEAALLAGLIRSPIRADPLKSPAAALTRRAQVLAAMQETGTATAAEAAGAAAVPLPRRAYRDSTRYPAAYAVQDAVTSLLDDPRLGETPLARQNALYRGGLTVRLTIDLLQQRQAEQSVAAVLLDPAHDPHAGLAAVKPGDGAITAMVGGRDFFSTTDRQAQVNLARGGTTKRQAGSTFKAFTLVAALEAGIKTDDRIEAGAHASLVCRHCPGRTWEVDNYEGTAFGRITVRQATVASVNTAYARIVERIGGGDAEAGTDKVVEVAERLGVRGRAESRVRHEPAVTLGAQEVDPVQMAAAYAALATGGVYAKPYLIAEVTDSTGKVLVRNTPQRKRVIAEGVAAVANDVLQDVVEEGTGVRARLARPVAGKPGTSTAYRDAWFVGYTPDLAAAVWTGMPAGQVSMTPENGFRTVVAGGTFPALIWGRFVGQALSGVGAKPFDDVAGSSITVEVDAVRGCRPNRFTPSYQVERRVYLRGTEPTAICTSPTGPPATEVPSVLGLRAAQATTLLDNVSLLVVTEEVYDLNYPPGVVVGQEPSSGSPVGPGATVRLRISGGRSAPVTVPSVIGLDLDTAQRHLAAAGLASRASYVPSCTGGESCAQRLQRESGLIWRQDVTSGSKVRAGTVVGLAVGPKYTPAPSRSPSTSPTASPSGSPTGSPSSSPSPTDGGV
ncbi:MAG TPA: transglycosylase domain-containing protein [Mycobacteriales bacterium]|nr:transglycosylase domain-containing protein [Mycobacteriales bacterium]